MGVKLGDKIPTGRKNLLGTAQKLSFEPKSLLRISQNKHKRGQNTKYKYKYTVKYTNTKYKYKYKYTLKYTNTNANT